MEQGSRGGTTTSIENLKELASILNERMTGRKGGANQRLAIMLGMLTKSKENPIKANIPDGERSNFSLVRYKFMLDAPFDISNKCCDVMKKEPAHRYTRETGRVAITAQMASESRLRTQKWLQNGCNGFDLTRPISNPMSFWLEQDVLLYIMEYIDKPLRKAWINATFSHGRKRRKSRKYLKSINYRQTAICSVYGDIVTDWDAMGQVGGQISLSEYGIFDKERPCLKCTGCQRTGCCLCGFGAHLEKSGEERFLRLKETHPGMYNLLDVIKNNGVTYREAIEWVNENSNGKVNVKLLKEKNV